MSNCHNLFLRFNGELSINSSKKSRLITSRNKLREDIRKYFKEYHSDYKPLFYGQGSYYLGTMIRTKDDTCDLDNGVYIIPKPDVTGTTLQGWVYEAVKNATSVLPQHKKKCIRVIYQGDYHIDLPSYYKQSASKDDESPYLAVKDDVWMESDPKAFKEWFLKQRDEKGQLVRLIKYLKAWCDNRARKMPNGLTMTVLACYNIVLNDRDDICLRDTLVAIKGALKGDWSCIMPTIPMDDLLASYSGSKDYFFESIDALIEVADKAIIDETNQLRASKHWQRHLGSYFPDGEDKDVDSQLNELNKSAAVILGAKAKLDSEGRIQTERGVDHQWHRNYGG